MGGYGKYVEFVPSTTEWTEIVCDFEVSRVLLSFPYTASSTNTYTLSYDVKNNTAKVLYNTTERTVSISDVNGWCYVENNIIYFKAVGSQFGKVWLIAIKAD